MLLFGFNASSSDAIVYGDVAIVYGEVEMTLTEAFAVTGSANFPIDFAGAPVVTVTGVGPTCSVAIYVTSVSSTTVQFRTPAFPDVGPICSRANYIAIGKI